MWFGVALAAVALVYLAIRGPREADVEAEDALDHDLVLEPVAG
jgi:hypothetical protein